MANKITKDQLLAMLAEVPGDAELDFFKDSIHYGAANPQASTLALYPGIHPVGIYLEIVQ